MEFFFHSLTTSPIVATFAFLIFFFSLTRIWKIGRAKSGEHKRQAPKAHGAWPIIGHMHLLGKFPHVSLASMADKNGPIFRIKLGVLNVLVVSNSDMAKDCLATNDKVFANRPKAISTEVLGYNYAMFALAPYGKYSRELRKIVTHELLSNSRIEMARGIRVSVVKSSLKDMNEFWLKCKGSSNVAKMDMKEWFGSLILNYVVKLIAGRCYSPGEEEAVKSRKAIRRFLEFMGMFMVSDAMPYLRWLDLGGHEKDMRAVAKDMDDVLEGWLAAHKKNRYSGDLRGDHHDFMDAIMSIVEGDSMKDRLLGFDPDTISKSTSLNLFVGATDTTTVTLIWALSLLLNNPISMKKARNELDMYVGKERQVEESDLDNLVYLQAIIKETLRLYPALPLNVPHESMEDCTVGGYHIPKGTRLLVNVWKIHRDNQVWSDPDEFQPDRFLTSHKHIDIKGQDFELIPFSSGRRMCTGFSFALQIMHLTLASLIHGFELTKKPSDEAIDMTESFGLTVMKDTPLEVNFKPRLSPNFYV